MMMSLISIRYRDEVPGFQEKLKILNFIKARNAGVLLIVVRKNFPTWPAW